MLLPFIPLGGSETGLIKLMESVIGVADSRSEKDQVNCRAWSLALPRRHSFSPVGFFVFFLIMLVTVSTPIEEIGSSGKFYL